MRVASWTATLGLLALLGAEAWAGDCGCGMASPGPRYNRQFCGDACSAMPYYNMSPGCCEYAPGPCDNAWNGYCQERARWQAYWTRFGTRANAKYGVMNVGSGPAGCVGCGSHVGSVEPAMPVEPALTVPQPATKPALPPPPIAPIPEPAAR